MIIASQGFRSQSQTLIGKDITFKKLLQKIKYEMGVLEREEEEEEEGENP